MPKSWFYSCKTATPTFAWKVKNWINDIDEKSFVKCAGIENDEDGIERVNKLKVKRIGKRHSMPQTSGVPKIERERANEKGNEKPFPKMKKGSKGSTFR